MLPLLLLMPTPRWAFFQPPRLPLYTRVQQAKLTACCTILTQLHRQSFLCHSPKDRLVSIRV